jgi:ABC-type dipeptide/oligopeptide/nickel transport system ATPase component
VTTENIRREWFKSISYIPQSSMNSLNPVVRIRDQFTDFPGTDSNKKRVLEKARAYIGKLGLPAEAMDSYPHQLSGGMRQRVMIALATFFQPELIIADEPTTALDVVVQKEILLLLMEVQELMGNTILVVSHDMGVHYQVTHKMLIMYAGRVVEYGDTESVFADPQHAYTKMLIDSPAHHWRRQHARRAGEPCRGRGRPRLPGGARADRGEAGAFRGATQPERGSCGMTVILKTEGLNKVYRQGGLRALAADQRR